MKDCEGLMSAFPLWVHRLSQTVPNLPAAADVSLLPLLREPSCGPKDRKPSHTSLPVDQAVLDTSSLNPMRCTWKM